jgi:glycosyltransferase involved in cell wall biosynthesis
MSQLPNFKLRILGIRGLPAGQGSSEIFAEHLALHLVKRGWQVVVYCQNAGSDGVSEGSDWHGVERINIPIPSSYSEAKATKMFHRQAFRHASQFQDLCLTLGYRTAAYCARLRLNGVPNLIHVDPLTWGRRSGGSGNRTRLRIDDLAECWLGNHLIAEHPQIAQQLETRVRSQKISTIGCGAKRLLHADPTMLEALGLARGGYLTVVSRAEPENSLLDIVLAFSARRRGIRLVVLGSDGENGHAYYDQMKAAASDEVMFLNGNRDKPVLDALRFYGLAYLHGNQVGRANMSLVEALGAGNAVIAHDNRYNRWAAGDGARYFQSSDDLCAILDEVLQSPEDLAKMRASSVIRFDAGFEMGRVLSNYENLLEQWLPTRYRVGMGI